MQGGQEWICEVQGCAAEVLSGPRGARILQGLFADLIDRLDLLLMHGDMSLPMKSILLRASDRITDLETRVQMLVHLIAMSPEYNVLQ